MNKKKSLERCPSFECENELIRNNTCTKTDKKGTTPAVCKDCELNDRCNVCVHRYICHRKR